MERFRKIIFLIASSIVITAGCKKYTEDHRDFLMLVTKINDLTVEDEDSISSLLETELGVSFDNDDRQTLDQNELLRFICYYKNREKPDFYFPFLVSHGEELTQLGNCYLVEKVSDDLCSENRPLVVSKIGEDYYFYDENQVDYAVDSPLREVFDSFFQVQLFEKEGDFSYLLDADLILQEQFVQACEDFTECLLFHACSDHKLDQTVLNRSYVKTIPPAIK